MIIFLQIKLPITKKGADSIAKLVTQFASINFHQLVSLSNQDPRIELLMIQNWIPTIWTMIIGQFGF